MKRHVEISVHARARMEERFPDVKGVDQTCRTEVLEAIAAGRRSKRKPLWCCTYTVAKGQHSRRFAWTEDETRCYVIRDMRRNGQVGLIVITVLERGDPDFIQRVDMSKGAERQTMKGKHAPRHSRVLDKRRFRA